MGLDAALPPGLFERIRMMIREEVGELLRAGLLRNASIGEGGGLTIRDGGNLTIRDGGDLYVRYREENGGGTAVYAGDLYAPGTNTYRGTGLGAFAEDGTAIAQFRTDNQWGDGAPVAEVYDAGQRVVFAPDAASGQGLARPYVPAVFHRARFGDWVTTTSGAFETLFTATLNRQHPRLYVQARASNDTAGATGEVRVLVNGVQWGATLPTQFLVENKTWGPAPVDGTHMASLTVQVQARVSGGGGGVRVEPSSCLGLQS